MTVMQFWQEIGVSAAVSARAEEVLREKKRCFRGCRSNVGAPRPMKRGSPR